MRRPTFDCGQSVIYRELWHDRVMTAMPLRVITDDERGTALYLAAETRFRAARAPDGGPVRDLSDWTSVGAIWTGGSAIRLLPADSWYCIDVEFDASRTFSGYYVNFQTPVRRTAGGFDTVDLVLDLEVFPDGADRVKDLEDFETAIAAGHISAEVAARVRTEAEDVRSEVKSKGAPDGAVQWACWHPPESWKVPTLDGVPPVSR